MLKRVMLIVLFAPLLMSVSAQRRQLFNAGWQFVKVIDTAFSTALLQPGEQTIKWENVSLPHTANIEPIEKVAQQWQGTCFYRKFFTLPAADKGKHIAVQFDAAMHEAEVYLNGQPIYRHLGGYLPFYIDISDKVKFGAQNSLLVRLNNQDNPVIPPAKPLKDLDFNIYSGLYRNAWMIVKDKLYISNAVAAGKTAGGGVMIHCDTVAGRSAMMTVQTEVRNDLETNEKVQLRLKLTDQSGKIVAQALAKDQLIYKGSFEIFTQHLTIPKPALWSPSSPNLYQLSIDVLHNGQVSDNETIRTGIKTVEFRGNAFFLNGKEVKIRGTNRHQEYPYVGYAVSDNAQYRDAWKIKKAGFNFVRTSHYPQSPAFLDACDELGLMVMDAIPGWQFVGNDSFKTNSYQNIRDMIHRDRNRAAIILWEASLNESGMKKDYMQKAHDIVHEELPFSHIYSAGWIDEVYDVFLPARQHAKAPEYWKKYSKNKPLLIAEYGDWEYYAQNAGFNQKEYQDLKAEERTSRQLRTSGQKGMLQQALNFQEAHNDNLYGPNVGDANWLMFDYKRGYAEDLETSGIMDINRLPKFAFYLYESQAEPVVNTTSPLNKPMLFIANYWSSAADSVVKIYSNCNEVELLVNGKSVGRQKPDKDQFSTNLKHAPFTFHLPAYTRGTITANGYIGHMIVAHDTRTTAGAAAGLRLRIDYSGKELKAGQNDVVFVYADVVDANGTVLYDAKDEITFEVKGSGSLIGKHKPMAEAGTATVLLQAGDMPGGITISAKARNLKAAQLTLYAK